VARPLLFSLARKKIVSPTEIVSIPDDDQNLDAFHPEQADSAADPALMVVVAAGTLAQPPAKPTPLSRVEAEQARRARKAWSARTLSQSRAAIRHGGAQVERAAAWVVGYGLALFVLIALRCDSCAHLVRRGARGGSRATWTALAAMSRRTVVVLRHARQHATALHRNVVSAIQRIAGAVRARRHAQREQPAEDTAIRHLEAEGSLVAVGLAVVAIGYGSLLVISWRHPATMVAAPAVAAAYPAVVDTTRAGTTTHATVAVAPILPDRAVDVRPRVRVMNASTLNTIWRRNDTRSLQQAFAGLRRETLAFHRCSVKMTAADRAVAQCEGVAGPVGADSQGAAPRATWTLDFQRTGGRWAIQRVTNR